MDKTLSDSEIEPYINNIILYNELENVSSETLLKHLPLAILYQATPTSGHWVLLHKTPEGIEFFDPYGYKPDQEFKMLKWQQPHYIAKLLLELQKIVPIHYSQYDFQQQDPSINTCGRWIIIRSLFSHMPLDIFAKMIVKACNNLDVTPDELAVLAFTE